MIRQTSATASTTPDVGISKRQPKKRGRPKSLESAAVNNPAACAELRLTWQPLQLRPTVAGAILISSDTLTFAQFLKLPYAKQLFTTGDCRLLHDELLKAREFQYFGIDVGKFRKHKTRTRKTLTRYVRRAYRGSARGVAYWGRVAKILWLAYENFLQLRYWACRTRDCELARLQRKARRVAKEKRRLTRRHKQTTERPIDQIGVETPPPK